MATSEATAVNSASENINAEYGKLNDLINDIAADQEINGKGGKGYNIGGINIAEGTKATDPGTMLSISVATSNQSLQTGGLTDLAMKGSALKKTTSQKVG